MDPKVNQSNRVNYLIKAASILPADNYFQKLLRSYYLSTGKRLAQIDEKHSNSLFSEEEMCRKCSTPWIDVNYSLSIAPIKTTKRKAKKIHKQIEEKAKRKGHLAKKLSKNVNNTMTIKCNLCCNKSKVILWKKAPVENKPSLASSNETDIAEKTNVIRNETKTEKSREIRPVVSSKKKRKKDKNAGLLFSVNKLDNSVKKVDINRKMQSLDIQRTSNVGKSMNQQVNKDKNKNQSKSKTNLAKAMKNIPQPAIKRNSLLQLAHALNAKGNQSGSKTSTDKLKQMLR